MPMPMPMPTPMPHTLTLSLLEQLRRVAAAPLALTPDGGISFLCAFLPRGSLLNVLHPCHLASPPSWGWLSPQLAPGLGVEGRRIKGRVRGG
eukprot:scaffold74224_cov36-Phaeocystis_antarctica.AAC.1